MEEAQREAFERLGYARVPEMVEELAAVARRGNPIAAIAADGSGKELLYGLAAADRCDPESPALQALVLSPTRDGAFRAAEALHALGLEGGLAALAWLPWSEAAEGSEERPFAQLVAGRPVELLPEVRSGRLKLGELKLLVLDGVTALEETGQWESVEAILDTLPAEAQKIAVDTTLSDRLKALVTHQLGRGKKWPPELFQPGAGRSGGAAAGGAGAEAGSGGAGDGGAGLLVAAADAAERRIDLLAEGLGRAAGGGDGAESAFVHCPDAATAHRVAAGLAARGFALTDEPGEPGVLVAWGEEETAGGAAALVGLPSGLPELSSRLGPARVRLAVVGTSELPQLRILAERAGWSLEAVPEPVPADARDTIERFRDAVRRRLEGWDDDAELLVLEPLLEEHGAARVAAALGALLRQRGPAAEAGAPGGAGASPGRVRAGERPAAAGPSGGRAPRGGREARDTGGRKRPAERSEEPGTRGTWFRLYISAGSRDGIGPNDIVGAITGETGAVGAQIGRIDVRSSFTLVDVDSQIAEQVMAGLSGASIKGRQVMARPDRES